MDSRFWVQGGKQFTFHGGWFRQSCMIASRSKRWLLALSKCRSDALLKPLDSNKTGPALVLDNGRQSILSARDYGL